MNRHVERMHRDKNPKGCTGNPGDRGDAEGKVCDDAYELHLRAGYFLGDFFSCCFRFSIFLSC